jgi:hypothetical protein
MNFVLSGALGLSGWDLAPQRSRPVLGNEEEDLAGPLTGLADPGTFMVSAKKLDFLALPEAAFFAGAAFLATLAGAFFTGFLIADDLPPLRPEVVYPAASILAFAII